MIKHLTNERLKYYQKLTDWVDFGKGWTDRAQKQMARAIAYIGENASVGGSLGLIAAFGVAYYLYVKYS